MKIAPVRGVSRNGRVLIVAHSDRGENIRIISACKTMLREPHGFDSLIVGYYHATT
jgi:uncharacterized DUF497 family protein